MFGSLFFYIRILHIWEKIFILIVQSLCIFKNKYGKTLSYRFGICESIVQLYYIDKPIQFIDLCSRIIQMRQMNWEGWFISTGVLRLIY